VLAPDESMLHPEARPVIAASLEAAKSRGAEVRFIQAHESFLPLEAAEMPLRGEHNLINACFATAIGRFFGREEEDIANALKAFRPQPHRMQEVGRFANVLYVNDSKSTNPDATIQALTAYAGLDMILLVGGQNKGADYHDLARAASARVKQVLCFGKAGPELMDALADSACANALCFSTMREALDYACKHALPHEVVLLSPANASFDEFDNYQVRGSAFVQLVKSFTKGNKGVKE
jgi:UDP-N-acetylmuramoylalanine--D-glutamate ligase